MIDLYVSNDILLENNVIVSGFWRSGTTWLQQTVSEAISAKTIFEPMNIRTGHTQIILYPSGPKERTFLRCYMPFHEDDLEKNVPLKEYLDRAMVSRISGNWVRRARNGTRDSFRTRVVLKFVQGHLCLTALSGRYHCNIIHIRRDPRAVMASIMRNGWWNGWLDSVSLREQLLQPEDGRGVHFSGWEEEIARWDRASPMERGAAYMALLERYVSARAPGGRIKILSYDEIMNGRADLCERLGDAGLLLERCSDMNISSVTTDRIGRTMNSKQKANRWRKELDPIEKERIEDIFVSAGLGEVLDH